MSLQVPLLSHRRTQTTCLITEGYVFKSLNSDAVKVNMALAEGYKKMKL